MGGVYERSIEGGVAARLGVPAGLPGADSERRGVFNCELVLMLIDSRLFRSR